MVSLRTTTNSSRGLGVGREQSRELRGVPFPWTSAGYTIRSRTSMNTVCHGCGGCGHLKWECPTLQRNDKATREGQGQRSHGCLQRRRQGKRQGRQGRRKRRLRRNLLQVRKQGHRAADCRTRVDMVDEYEDEDECEMQPIGGVWTNGQIEVQKNRGLGKPATGSRPSRSTTRTRHL